MHACVRARCASYTICTFARVRARGAPALILCGSTIVPCSLPFNPSQPWPRAYARSATPAPLCVCVSERLYVGVCVHAEMGRILMSLCLR